MIEHLSCKQRVEGLTPFAGFILKAFLAKAANLGFSQGGSSRCSTALPSQALIFMRFLFLVTCLYNETVCNKF